MKRMQFLMIVSSLIVVLSVSAAFAERKDFSSEKLRAALNSKLQDAEQELSQAGDILEKRSQEFLDLIDKEVDEGFVKLDVFRKDLDRKVEGLKQDLGTVLDEEKLAELKDFFEHLDENVIASIQDELIAQLEVRLGVTSEQLKQLTPILREEFQKRSALLEKYLGQGLGQFEAYQAKNDQLWQGTLTRLKKALNTEQVQELERWRSELQEKIRRAFSEKK